MSKKMKVLIVAATFYREITNMLIDGACKILNDMSLQYDIIEVPGALEIAPVISMAIESKTKYDGYIALGCVIRGETGHYDIVAQESARAIMELSCDNKIAIGNGILTVENKEQAIIRASIRNKGAKAAKACVALIKIKNNFM